jgi:hypothetical protein
LAEGADGAREGGAFPPSAPASADVRCIAPPRLDGGTAFVLVAPWDGWHPELRRVVEDVRRSAPGRTTRSTMALDSPSGERLLFDVIPEGNHVALVAEGRAQIDLFAHQGRAVLRATAAELEAVGFEAWGAWFDRATWWIKGARCAGPREARSAGWATRNIELASDFAGLAFYSSDPQLFTNARGRARRVDSEGFASDGTIETLNIGKRGSNAVAVSTHDKTAVLLKDGIDPASSVYSLTWKQRGWSGERVRRVEVRARGSALRAEDKRTGEVIDLSDPAALLDAETLGRFWRYATTKRTRLVLSTTSRVRRAPTDPRWVAVQDAGGCDDGARFQQAPRDRLRLTVAEKLARDEQQLARSVRRVAVLAGAHDAAELLPRIRELVSPEEIARERARYAWMLPPPGVL